MKTIDQLSIRKQNILRIWDLFAQRSPLTRQELAEGAELSLMSVSNLVEQLSGLNVLEFRAPTCEEGCARRSAGRKADLISLDRTRNMWLVFDLTDEYLRFMALGLDLSVLLNMTAFSGELAYAENLRAFLSEMKGLVETKLVGRKVLGVAIITPGPYDIRQDTIKNQRIPELNHLHIKQVFRASFGAYDYYVDEDVKFAVRGYMPYCAKAQCEVLYYLYIGEGVGGAAVHNENVMRGLNAVAGDAGQLMAQGGERYEKLLSVRAFARACALDVSQELSGDELLRRMHALAAKEPERYKAVLKEQAAILGCLLHMVVWLLDPSAIVIDCRYARPYEQFFLEKTDEALRGMLENAHLNRPALLAAAHETQSALSGVVHMLSREWIGRVIL